MTERVPLYLRPYCQLGPDCPGYQWEEGDTPDGQPMRAVACDCGMFDTDEEAQAAADKAAEGAPHEGDL